MVRYPSQAGVVLERYVSLFEGEAVLSPIINGVGGNLGAVLASRISTALHCGTRQPHGMAGVSLFILVVPASLLVLFMINILGAGHVDITPLFVVGYTIAAMCQVGLLLPLSGYIVNLVWRRQLDPDDVSGPFL